jgi:hypothetical protein
MNKVRVELMTRYQALTNYQSRYASQVARRHAKGQFVSAEQAKHQLIKVEAQLAILDWVLDLLDVG